MAEANAVSNVADSTEERSFVDGDGEEVVSSTVNGDNYSESVDDCDAIVQNLVELIIDRTVDGLANVLSWVSESSSISPMQTEVDQAQEATAYCDGEGNIESNTNEDDAAEMIDEQPSPPVEPVEMGNEEDEPQVEEPTEGQVLSETAEIEAVDLENGSDSAEERVESTPTEAPSAFGIEQIASEDEMEDDGSSTPLVDSNNTHPHSQGSNASSEVQNIEEFYLDSKCTEELQQARQSTAQRHNDDHFHERLPNATAAQGFDHGRVGLAGLSGSSGTAISSIAAQLADKRIRNGGVSVTVSPLPGTEPQPPPVIRPNAPSLVGSQRRKKGHTVTSMPFQPNRPYLPPPYVTRPPLGGRPIVPQQSVQYLTAPVSKPNPNPYIASPALIGALQANAIRPSPPPANRVASIEPMQNGHARLVPNGIREGRELPESQQEAWSMLLDDDNSVTCEPISLPPANLGLDIPAGGYGCPGRCGHAFALKSSLEFHLARKIFNANAQCRLCQNSKPVSFYNRCTFWKHIKQHYKDGKSVTDPRTILNELTVQPIKGVAVEHAFDSWFASPAFVRLADVMALNTYEISQSQKYVMDKKDNERKRQAEVASMTALVNCTECGESVPSADLRGHFVHNTPTAQKQFICQQCSAVFFSSCSFSAHRRTKHEHAKLPYTCPECGLIQNSAQTLHEHQFEHRTAPTVLQAWRCPKCTTFYSNRTTLIVHYTSAHCIYTHKCSICAAVLDQSASLDEHRAASHPQRESRLVTMPGPCPLCPPNTTDRIASKEAMVEHIKEHLKTTPAFCVFRCPICGRLMENKHGLGAHYTKVHGLDVPVNSIDDTPFPIKNPTSSEERVQQSNSPAVHAAAAASSHDESAAKKPRIENNVPVRSDVIKCQKYLCEFVTRDIDHMRQHALAQHKENDNRHFLCLDCGLSFYTDISLKRHLLALHKVSDAEEYLRRYPECVPNGSVQSSACDVCGRRFDSKPALLAHKRTHGVAFLNSLHRNTVAQQNHSNMMS